MTRVRRYVRRGEEFYIWDDITNWCFVNFGLPSEDGDWKYQPDVNYMDFYFRDTQSAEFFILKWM